MVGDVFGVALFEKVRNALSKKSRGKSLFFIESSGNICLLPHGKSSGEDSAETTQPLYLTRMNLNHESVWANCLSFIEDNVSAQAFKTWFIPIKAVKLEDAVLTIQVPSQFFYEWLEAVSYTHLTLPTNA